MKLQPYAQQSVVNRPFPKLAYKFYGPYTVMDKIGTTAYKLALPEDSQIHPVYPVSQLKPFTPNYTPVFTEVAKLVDLSTQELAPEVVLDKRLVKKGSIPSNSLKQRNIRCTNRKHILVITTTY